MALSLSHFTCDLYSGSIPMLLLFASRSLGFGLTEAGLVGTVYGIFSSLTQPLFGYLGDLKGGRWFVVGGVAVMTVFQMLMGLAPSYWLLILCAAFAGMGSAAFHPQGASGASRSGGDKKTSAMSIFMFGGNFGYGTGPALAGVIGDVLGRAALPIMSLVGLILVPVLFKLTGGSGSPSRIVPGKTLLKVNPAFTKLGVAALLITMMARAWLQAAATFFTPVFFTTLRGFTAAQAGTLSTINLWSLALGTLVGGLLADRIGPRRVMLFSFLCSAPLMFLYWNVVGVPLYLVAVTMGFLVGWAWPPLIVLSQELFPKSAGLASGIALGFAFAMGYVGQGINSFLAAPERLGLIGSMMIVPVLGLVGALAMQALPKREAIAASAAARLTLAQ